MTLSEIKDAITDLFWFSGKIDLDEEVRGSNVYMTIQRTITDLDASNSGLPPPGILILAKIVAESNILQTLNLSGNGLRGYGIEAAKDLAKSTTLTTLNMDNNNLDYYKYSCDLPPSLDNNSKRIKSNLSESGTEFAQVLTHSTSLTSLYIRNNNLGSGSASDIIEVLLEGLPTLRLLDISSNGLYNTDIYKQQNRDKLLREHNQEVEQRPNVITILKFILPEVITELISNYIYSNEVKVVGFNEIVGSDEIGDGNSF